MTERFLDLIQIVCFDVSNSRHQRFKWALISTLPSGGDCADRAAVKRLMESNNLVIPIGSLGVAMFLCDLQTGLIGRRTAWSEKHLIHPRQAAKLLSKLSLRCGQENVGRMNQLLGLAGDRGDDGGMAVPQTIDRDACKEVEVLVPSVIPKDRSRTLDE